jgi:LacI family transcriptional regulator
VTKRAVSIREVAMRAGVSLGTVSNVLNRPESVAEPTRRAVLTAIEELGYVRNASASRLRAKKSMVMGVLVVDYANPFVTAYVEAAEQALATYGYSAVVAGTGFDFERVERQLLQLEEFRVAGVVLPPIFTEELAPRIEAMRARGMSFAYVGGISSTTEGCSTDIDQMDGGRLAGQHLLEIGRRRIVFVTGPRDLDFATIRLDGLRAAAAGRDDVVIKVVTIDDLTGLEGHAATDAILEYEPDAVFCANDLTALGVLRGLIERGRRVPDDIALIGYDDIIFAEIATVPLTTIRQPPAIGAAAAELLVNEANESDHIHRRIAFAPELVVRDTTVPTKTSLPKVG